MTLEWEHCCKNLIALCPKNYFCDNGKKKEIKLKGVSTRGCLNQHIDEEAFKDCIFKKKITNAENYVLRTKDHEMTKQILRKTGISGVITKCVLLENQACAPFLHGVTADKYSVV
jgi:hypothetical protein